MLTLNKPFTLVGPDGKPYPSTVPGTLGGHRGGKLYGRLDCRAALQAIARGGYVKHRVFFADEATAIAAGYRPCAVCMPQEYAVWKKSQGGGPSSHLEVLIATQSRWIVPAPAGSGVARSQAAARGISKKGSPGSE